MGELITISQLKEMLKEALDKGGMEVAVFLLGNSPVRPVIKDDQPMWWKHEVERALSMP
jgi:hypothetical protein